MKKRSAKLISMAVTVIMCTSLISTAAFADEGTPEIREDNLLAEEDFSEEDSITDEISEDIISETGEEESVEETTDDEILEEDMDQSEEEVISLSEISVFSVEENSAEENPDVEEEQSEEVDEEEIMTLDATIPTEGGEIASGDYILEEDIEISSRLEVNSGSTVTLDLNGHTLTFTGSNYTDSAVWMNGGDFTLKASGGGVISGGGVYVDSSKSVFTMYGGTITGGTGSGVHVYKGTFYMYGGTITGNSNTSGGGVYVSNGTFVMYDGSITDNATTGNSAEGGGVYVAANGTFDMQGGSITANHAVNGGGVFFASSETITLSAGDISGNMADKVGGGIYVGTGDDFTLSGGTITGNSAGTNGGGIYFRGNDTAAITGGIISGNSASLGGGIYFENNSASTYDTCTMSGGTITGNSAASGGGVYINTKDSFALVGGALYGNTAQTEAADVFAVAGEDMTLMDASGMNASDAVFNGWYADTADARYADGTAPVKVENINDDSAAESLIAAYNITLAYDLNGDNAEGSVPDAESKDATYTGGAAAFTTASDEGLVKENCHFAGWNTAEDGSGTSYDAGTDITLTEDTTLYADWHELTYMQAKDATCTEDGNIAYWYCADCETYFADESGETEISEEDTVIAALGHEWVVEETMIEDSEDRYEEKVSLKCSRCGEEQEEEIVVATESGEDLTVHSSLKWNDLISADDLAALFESGAEIDFTLAAEKYTDSDVPSADKDLVENKIEELWDGYDYTVSYLDIDVLMDILHANGDEEIREFTETINPIEITVEIPDELLEADGDTYTVIRVHDDAAEELESTEEDGTLTFSSDKFSTYGLVKLSESEEEPGTTDNPDDNGNTGDTGSSGGTGLNGGNGSTGENGTGSTGNGGSSNTSKTDGTGTAGAKTADTNAPILYGILIILAGAAIVTFSVRRYVVRR